MSARNVEAKAREVRDSVHAMLDKLLTTSEEHIETGYDMLDKETVMVPVAKVISFFQVKTALEAIVEDSLCPTWKHGLFGRIWFVVSKSLDWMIEHNTDQEALDEAERDPIPDVIVNEARWILTILTFYATDGAPVSEKGAKHGAEQMQRAFEECRPTAEGDHADTLWKLSKTKLSSRLQRVAIVMARKEPTLAPHLAAIVADHEDGLTELEMVYRAISMSQNLSYTAEKRFRDNLEDAFKPVDDSVENAVMMIFVK